jgi:hypothetical protein
VRGPSVVYSPRRRGRTHRARWTPTPQDLLSQADLRVIDVLKLHETERTDMASSGKRKTTMAKLTRESRLRERRVEKQARKEARKRAALDHPEGPGEVLTGDVDESFGEGAGEPPLESVAQTPADR